MIVDSVSVRFFETQFRRQLSEGDLRLNPFETAVLPHLHGRVLDFGCGLGNLSLAAAEAGCSVLALDASPSAVCHLQELALARRLPIEAVETDLRTYVLAEDFDTVVSIGLLMFLDRATAVRQLENLKAHVKPGGVAAINVLVEGTTYMEMFDPDAHCLFPEAELARRFEGWEILLAEHRDFPAPGDTVKSFLTIAARKR
jgi:tellurite methyltransferase